MFGRADTEAVGARGGHDLAVVGQREIIQAVEEAVGHELLQLARDLQERVDLERQKINAKI